MSLIFELKYLIFNMEHVLCTCKYVRVVSMSFPYRRWHDDILHYLQMEYCRMWPSGMLSCVDLVLTDVSEERIASIFRVEKFASEEPVRAGGCSLQTRISEWLRWRGPAAIVNDRHNLSPERMLRKDYDRKCSVGKICWSWVSRGLSSRRTDWL
jgi:hypothetical protein